MIQKMEARLLSAVACLAGAIDAKRSTEMEEREIAFKEFYALLKSQEIAVIYERRYPGRFWSAKSSTKSLPSDYSLLTSMCQDIFAQEKVIGILYRSPNSHWERWTVSKCPLEFESREMFKRVCCSNASLSSMREWGVSDFSQKVFVGGFYDTATTISVTLPNRENVKLAEKMEPEIVNEEQTIAAMLFVQLALCFENLYAAGQYVKCSAMSNTLVRGVRSSQVHCAFKWRRSKVGQINITGL